VASFIEIPPLSEETSRHLELVLTNNGRTDGRTDRRTDGRTDRPTDNQNT